MNMLLVWSINGALVMLGLAMACSTFRLVWGPRAQDRVLGLDSLYVNAMLLLLAFGIRSGSSLSWLPARRSLSSARWGWCDFKPFTSGSIRLHSAPRSAFPALRWHP